METIKAKHKSRLGKDKKPLTREFTKKAWNEAKKLGWIEHVEKKTKTPKINP